MFTAKFSMSAVMGGWHRAAAKQSADRGKRFAAGRLRRKMLLRAVMGAWAQSARHDRRTKVQEEHEGRLREELGAAERSKQAALAEAAAALEASEADTEAARAETKRLQDRVRLLLARGFEEVGLNAAKAVQTSLGLVETDDEASPSGRAGKSAGSGALGLLRMLLDAEVDGQKRGRRASRASRAGSVSPPRSAGHRGRHGASPPRPSAAPRPAAPPARLRSTMPTARASRVKRSAAAVPAGRKTKRKVRSSAKPRDAHPSAIEGPTASMTLPSRPPGSPDSSGSASQVHPTAVYVVRKGRPSPSQPLPTHREGTRDGAGTHHVSRAPRADPPDSRADSGQSLVAGAMGAAFRDAARSIERDAAV